MDIHLLVPKLPKDDESALQASLELFSVAAEKRGHTLIPIESRQCKMLFNGKPRLLINGEKPAVKVIISKPGFQGFDIYLHGPIIRQFEILGYTVINRYQPVADAKNKVRSLQILSKNKLPLPKTYVVHSADYISSIMDDIGNYPVILKSITGMGGLGVAIIESKRGLKSVIEMMLAQDSFTPMIIQEYIKESSGRDIRIFVIGNKIVAAMERIAVSRGEFRSNFSIGGKIKIAELTTEEKKLALKATKVSGLDYAGVDIIRSKNGPRIIEVNSNPGLKGITQATQKDIAGEIIEYAVQKYRENRSKK